MDCILWLFTCNSGNSSIKRFTILAEIASCQLEYSYLAKATGKKEHYDRVRPAITCHLPYMVPHASAYVASSPPVSQSAKIMQALEKGNILRRYGMFPTKWNLMSGEPISGMSSSIFQTVSSSPLI